MASYSVTLLALKTNALRHLLSSIIYKSLKRYKNISELHCNISVKCGPLELFKLSQSKKVWQIKKSRFLNSKSRLFGQRLKVF